MFDIGRLCVKIAGRDSNKTCVIIDTVDDRTVLITGQTRRRRCNVKHLAPLDKVVKIKKGAPFAEVAKVFAELGIELKETKPKKATKRPIKVRKAKPQPVKDAASQSEHATGHDQQATTKKEASQLPPQKEKATKKSRGSANDSSPQKPGTSSKKETDTTTKSDQAPAKNTKKTPTKKNASPKE